MAETAVEVWIPDGYLALPLVDIDQHVAAVATILADAGSAEVRAIARAVLPAAAALLGRLATREVRFLGLGRHLGIDGEVVTSCLTIAVLRATAPGRNPRLLLTHLVESRAESGELGETEVREVDDRPMLFSERLTALPTPEIPGRPYDNDSTDVYQLEAVIPAADGTALASIELSTPNIDSGPNFRKMVIDMARSITLPQASNKPDHSSSLDL